MIIGLCKETDMYTQNACLKTVVIIIIFISNFVIIAIIMIL